MPTSRPRYVVTDTGPVREMLDAAQAVWPQETSRKALLLRLAGTGAQVLEQRVEEEQARSRRSSQLDALARASKLIEVDVLLSDGAWN